MVSLWLATLAGALAACAEDPFADVTSLPMAGSNGAEAVQGPRAAGWTDNLLFRRELYWLGGVGGGEGYDGGDLLGRYSVGGEVQKRFATATRTVASLDYQGRVVWRERGPEVSADPMGRDASRWEYETHNAYVDFYNIAGDPGRFNFRAGHFYQPFGLNTQTDTHGTLLQLSNDRVFGAERDWQGILHGALAGPFDYQIGYLVGAGPDHEYRDQSGMGVARLALNNDWLFQHGLEGGISVAAGERVDPHVSMPMADGHAVTDEEGEAVIRTRRFGLDARRRFDSRNGPVTVTLEGAVGSDEEEPMLSALAQADWLNPGRRWGTALQYYFYRQEGGDTIADMTEEAAIATLTRYFRNDVGNANLHWVAVGVERPLRSDDRPRDPVFMVQYYRYW